MQIVDISVSDLVSSWIADT